MVGGFLMVNPSDRFSSNHHNGMQEIKALPYFKGLNWDGTAAAAITLGPFRHPFGYFDILLAISTSFWLFRPHVSAQPQAQPSVTRTRACRGMRA